MLWVQRSTAEEGADVEIGWLAARRSIRFMADEHALSLGVAA